jgi:hypothetical protein
MALSCDPLIIVTEWVSGVCRQRIGRFLAYARDDQSEKEGEACGDEGDDHGLDLEQGKIANDEGVPDGGDVEVAHVGGGAETGGEIHFNVAFKVKDDRDDRDQFVDTRHRFPVLRRYKTAPHRQQLDAQIF